MKDVVPLHPKVVAGTEIAVRLPRRTVEYKDNKGYSITVKNLPWGKKDYTIKRYLIDETHNFEPVGEQSGQRRQRRSSPNPYRRPPWNWWKFNENSVPMNISIFWSEPRFLRCLFVGTASAQNRTLTVDASAVTWRAPFFPSREWRPCSRIAGWPRPFCPIQGTEDRSGPDARSLWPHRD